VANPHRQRLVPSCLVQGLRVAQKLHGEVGLPAPIEAVIEHADDVRMAQTGQRPELLGQV
jgi:hypothetical protein